MLTENKELMRALCPKITPQAAARMFSGYMVRIAVTTATLGLVWWESYIKTATEVLWPDGNR